MNRQYQPELFSQRPVRSDFARGRRRGLNVRKVFFMLLLIGGAVGGGLYYSVNYSNTTTATEETPTIQADMPLKQRPEEPGGIDIPHQDVTVFQKLDGATAEKSPKANVEHLLPEPETPKVGSTDITPPVTEKQDAAPVTAAPAEELPPAITEAVPEPAKAPTQAVEPEVAKAVKETAKEVAKEAATVKKTVEKKVVSEKDKALADKTAAVLDAAKKVGTASEKAAEAPTRLPAEMFTAADPTPPITVATSAAANEKAAEKATDNGKKVQIQLASYPDETAAQKEVARFQNKYAGILGTTTLRVVRADLGSKGIYYRVMGSASESKAKAICTDITKQKGNCIVVK